MKRVQWPLPQPQPVTPLRGCGVVALTFEDYVCARLIRKLAGYDLARLVDPAVLKLYDTYGAYAVKPKRDSCGVVWDNQAFWWSAKGYYRPGLATGPRRPLQHYIWEKLRGKMPAGHEIFFKDRDRHNFTLENMEMLSKAEVHRRTHLLGETRVLGFEERSQIRGRWATKHSRDITTLLLERAQTTNKGASHGLITRIKER